MLPRAPHDDPSVLGGTAPGREGNPTGSGEVLARQGAGLPEDVREGSRDDDLTALGTGSGPDVHDPVRRADRVLVVLHHDDRVPQVPQPLEGVDEPVVVALVESHAGLVQHVQDPHEAGADLGRQPDALGLPTGEGVRSAVQREVIKPHVHQELQARPDLLQDALRDEGFALAQPEIPEELQALPHGEGGDLRDVLPAHPHREAGSPQPRALALRAGSRAHVLLDLLLHGLGVRLPVAALQVGDDAFEVRVVDPQDAVPVVVAHADRLIRSVEERPDEGLGELPEGSLHVHAVGGGEGTEQLVVVLARGGCPGHDGSVGQGLIHVQHEVWVDLLPEPKARAGGAGAVGAVEGEDAGLDLRQGRAVVGAGEGRREHHLLAPPVLGLPPHVHETLAELEGRLEGVVEA